MSEKRCVFYGWWVMVGLFVIGMLGPLGRYSVTAFLPFLSAELGWSRSSIGLGQSVNLWMYSLFVILSGTMVDRIGSRKTFFIGGIVTLMGWIALSVIKSSCQFYLSYGFLMAFAVALTHTIPLQSTTRKWFRKRAGLMAGITATAFAAGTAIFLPIMTRMADSYGWRSASVIFGIGIGVIITLVAFFVIRDTPESMGLFLDGENRTISDDCLKATGEESWTVREAVKTVQLWLLFISYSMIAIPLNGALASLVAWGVDVGSTKEAAGFFVTALTVPSIFGKIGGGWLGDRYGKQRLLFIAPVLGMLSMFYGWQGVHTQRSLAIFAIFMGLSYGLSMAMYSPYLGDLFGRAHLGSLLGIITLGFGLIGGCGPLIWGSNYSISENYTISCQISTLCYAIAATAILFIRPTKARGIML